MEEKWRDLSIEGKHLRYVHNKILKRFKKHSKSEDDYLMLKAAESLCTVANTQRRLVEGIKYEHRLEDIEKILMAIEPEAIQVAKRKLGM
ncbi:MAG: hypothetical protein OES34_11300 [Nitrosopumilus sp.]|nr:hypothetical protein [Nitrosopumilus sp.]